MDESIKEEIKKKRKDNWFELLFSIEALAVNQEVVESSLQEHVNKIKKTENVFVYETNFYETKEVEKPFKNVEKAYSQIVSMKLFIKDLFTLLNTVILFGPSSIEVLGPDKKEISLSEVQNVANQIAGLVHQFAAAGLGGMLIMAPKKEGQA